MYFLPLRPQGNETSHHFFGRYTLMLHLEDWLVIVMFTSERIQKCFHFFCEIILSTCKYLAKTTRFFVLFEIQMDR